MRLLDRLDAWKTNFGQGDTRQLEKLLTAAARWRLRTPAEAIRFHETLLCLRAYPRSSRVAHLADRLLFHFADRIARLESAGADAEPFEAPQVSGIAGTSLGASVRVALPATGPLSARAVKVMIAELADGLAYATPVDSSP
ncbi:MAG: hypothetical protein ACLQU1_01620 [Bryobacteraceae bacterium]